eukprot:TRINITY_DN66392_c9_g1_i10.p1 TRINITY_DN66392_c9_g1~~TRINITY_DN66392_c9_g1_i10.p1  ORF type:complete len:266 (-),score=107.13 TRINITY_DN66392_c9_g1_i10:1235-2032(-)
MAGLSPAMSFSSGSVVLRRDGATTSKTKRKSKQKKKKKQVRKDGGTYAALSTVDDEEEEEQAYGQVLWPGDAVPSAPPLSARSTEARQEQQQQQQQQPQQRRQHHRCQQSEEEGVELTIRDVTTTGTAVQYPKLTQVGEPKPKSQEQLAVEREARRVALEAERKRRLHELVLREQAKRDMEKMTEAERLMYGPVVPEDILYPSSPVVPPSILYSSSSDGSGAAASSLYSSSASVSSSVSSAGDVAASAASVARYDPEIKPVYNNK